MENVLDHISDAKREHSEYETPLFDERYVLEKQTPDMLLKVREECLAKMNKLEKYVFTINEVLEGYGIDPYEGTEFAHEPVA